MREDDVFQAAKNDLIRKREVLITEIRTLDEEIAALGRIQARRSGETPDEIPSLYPMEFGRGQISTAIRRWLKDSGKKQGDFFTAKEVTDFMKSKGYRSAYIYNSVFECCKRLVQNGELKKVENGFEVVKLRG